jgi:hypothetical protein
LVVIAGERAKNIRTGGLKKNVKNFTAQNAVRKMFFEEKFLKLIKKFFVRNFGTYIVYESGDDHF